MFWLGGKGEMGFGQGGEVVESGQLGGKVEKGLARLD